MKQKLLDNECIICIEPENCIIVKKNTHCECEYSVHKRCLNKWIQKQNKCIICRKTYTNNLTSSDYNSLFELCVLLLLNLFGIALLFCLTFGTMFVIFYICVKIF